MRYGAKGGWGWGWERERVCVHGGGWGWECGGITPVPWRVWFIPASHKEQGLRDQLRTSIPSLVSQGHVSLYLCLSTLLRGGKSNMAHLALPYPRGVRHCSYIQLPNWGGASHSPEATCLQGREAHNAGSSLAIEYVPLDQEMFSSLSSGSGLIKM